MLIFGAPLALRIHEDIQARIERLSRPPRLVIVSGAPNKETETYLALKKKRAEALGISVRVVTVPGPCTTEGFIETLETLLPDTDGIVVQLPLPSGVERDRVLAAVPPTHDCDALNPRTTAVMPPVVGAIAEMMGEHQVDCVGKRVVIIGRGRLVGEPASRYFTERGALVTSIDQTVLDLALVTRSADIIVCGAGVPGLLRPEHLAPGVVIFDAGTSEDGGVLKGDADPACAEVASFMTPVPGGIGPLTIAVLLRNLVALCEEREKTVV
jgi:methylenetetrahydrofolate dehydrogenase (NADP+)/methenyltetrahydrofolate cyclohydrolase